MNSNEHHGCGAADCSCTATILSPPSRSLDWSDMLALACRHVGKFAVYGNYTARPQESEQKLEWLCKEFFTWCDNLGIEQGDQHRILTDLLGGNAALFDTSEEAGQIFRFFLQKGIYGTSWFACLVSPTEGIVTENT